ncbi:uncharacterized protein [Narcine bancroftii]|uniref:uncharacterized protein isoform X2 n=1 Tax=Narcine bancroftii TaxID=1343680 RepID=UPI003831C122
MSLHLCLKTNGQRLCSSEEQRSNVVTLWGEWKLARKLDELLLLTSGEGALNATVDSGTAKVKQRPTVKLGIPPFERPSLAVASPTVQDQAMFSKFPRTIIIAGSDGKSSVNQSKAGSHGNGTANVDDGWIPPPPAMAPPPPPVMAPPPPPVQSPHAAHLPYEVSSIPPPPNMAPPPPPAPAPPPLNSTLHQNPNIQAAKLLPEDSSLPAPEVIHPAPPLLAPPKPLPMAGHPPQTPPPVLPPSDYAVKHVHNDHSKSAHIKHPKMPPPPPPQRGVTTPPKPERNLPRAPNLLAPSTSNKPPSMAEPPEAVSKVASTFNPKATAKLYGFSDPVFKAEASSDSERKMKTKSLIIMQDAEPMVGTNPNDSVQQKAGTGRSTDQANISKIQTDSSACRPQKPARKNQALAQQTISAQNMHLGHYDLPIDYPIPDLTGSNRTRDNDVPQTHSNRTQHPQNYQPATNAPVSSLETPVGNGKSGAEAKTKPNGTGDSERLSSSGNDLTDFPSANPLARAIKAEGVPDPSAEENGEANKQRRTLSPLTLLMNAKQRDLRSRNAPKPASETLTLSMGGTRYIKSRDRNTFQIVPRSNYRKTLMSPEEQDIRDGVDVTPLRGTERNRDWPEPSLHPTSDRAAELEDSQNDQDMSSLLLPPPPLFRDESNEELPLSFLPPPLEFSNHSSSGNNSPQPDLKGSGESRTAHSDKTGLSLQGPAYRSGDHWTSSHQNNPIGVNSYFISQPSVNAPSSLSHSNGQKPLLPPKPQNTNLNEGSANLHNANKSLTKPQKRNVPKVELKPAETGLLTKNLLAKNHIGELQSKVETLSIQPDVHSKSLHSAQASQSYGRTFAIRPGTKQPMTVVNPSTTK